MGEVLGVFPGVDGVDCVWIAVDFMWIALFGVVLGPALA